MPFELKRKVYGKNRVDVGGRADESDGGEESNHEDEEAGDDDNNPPCFIDGVQQYPQVRAPKNIEPVCYQSLPTEFFEEAFESYYVRELYDLTPGDGAAAKAALASRKSYVGVCHTTAHAEELYKMLTNYVTRNFDVQASPFYQASYATQQGTKRDAESQDKGKASPKKKPKKKDKKKPKKEKKKSSSSSSSSGSGSGKSN